MSHNCHAIDCNVATPPEMFMCRRHWFSVPRPMRRNVSQNYRRGQCDDWKITQAYCDAAKIAVKYIAKIEGKDAPDDHPALLLYDMLSPTYGDAT